MKKLVFISFVFTLFLFSTVSALSLDNIPGVPGQTGSSGQTSLVLKAGWNLVSSPVEDGTSKTAIAEVCEIKSGPWTYNVVTGEYKKSDKIMPFTGAWVKVKNDCSITSIDVPVSAMKALQLSKGWNLISGVGAFSSLGGCTVTSGPWEYNAATDGYVKAKTLTTVKGYWVKVSSDCTLDFVGAAPKPDLAVTDITLMPSGPALGDKFYVVAKFKNQGSDLAYVSPAISSGGAVIISRATYTINVDGADYGSGALNSGNDVPAGWEGSAQSSELVYAVPGKHKAKVTITYFGDGNTANNAKEKTIAIGPDLVIDSIKFSVAKATVSHGFNITVAVKNQGTDTAQGSKTPFNLAISAESRTAVTQKISYNIAPGTTAAITYDNPYSFGAAGVYKITADVDTNGNLAESDETNNQKTETIAVIQ